MSDKLSADRLEKRFHGRRTGRPLNTQRKQALKTLLPILSIPEDLLKENQTLLPRDLFTGSEKTTTLEIGFGNGEHLDGLLRRDPDQNYIGVEPFENGMAAFLKDSDEGSFDNNLRVLMDDAFRLVYSLADNTIDTLYILNPDPWHKTRHHKRRIVRDETVAHYARIIKTGGALIVTTDVPDLADWMFTAIMANGAFEWTAQKADDWRKPPKDWITTRYETKGAKGAQIMSYLLFKRK